MTFRSIEVFTYHRNMQTRERLPYVLDYDMDQNRFREILSVTKQ